MSNNDSNDNDPKNQDGRPPAEPGFNWRGLILLSIAVGLIGAALWFKGGGRDV
jgi:hypothetical protein